MAVHPVSADTVGVCVGAPGAGNVEHQEALPDGTIGNVYVYAGPAEDPVRVDDEPNACCFDFSQCCMCGVDGAVMMRVGA
jgi:hypothetical protein